MNATTPPSRESTDRPGYLTAHRRVVWDPVSKKVEKDSLHHDQLLSAARATFNPGAFDHPPSLSEVLARMSDVKRVAANEQAQREHEQEMQRLRDAARKPSILKHPVCWKPTERAFGLGLWRCPDATPNAPPDTNFRARFVLDEG